MSGPYEEMIDLPHHVSNRHPHMPLRNRAAQFAPFAALTGYDACVREAARIADSKMELDESEKAFIDLKLREIADNLEMAPDVSITYFLPDKYKSGGSYINAEGKVKKIDSMNGAVFMTNGTKIPIESIISVTTDKT